MKRIHLYVIVLSLFIGSIFRLWNLNYPSSLFGDELDLGYHALSISKTGKDYSGNFMPIHFHSFAEWRTPLYIYAAVPTVALFGISPLGVRLPAALFGIALIPVMYFFSLTIIKKYGYFKGKENLVASLSALVISISPWHIHYSRAGFEVTMLLLFLVLGITIFIWSMANAGRLLWLSALLLSLTPWIYSTAKLYLPMILVLLIVANIKAIIKIPKRTLFVTLFVGFALLTPITYDTIFGGGAERFSYLSIINDPSLETQVGEARTKLSKDLTNLTFIDRAFHNQYTIVAGSLINNYFSSFSAEFLFVTGDGNPRHSLPGFGVMHKVEFILIVLGVLAIGHHKRLPKLLLILLVLAPIPSALTRDGATHATRLILMLPFLVFMVTMGIGYVFSLNKFSYKSLLLIIVFGSYLLSLTSFANVYFRFYDVENSNIWHKGWEEVVKRSMKELPEYDQLFVTYSKEPPWVFFVGWSQFPVDVWHKNYPLQTSNKFGLGEMTYINNIYFGTPESDGKKIDIYELPKKLPARSLYIANASEIGADLKVSPERTPPGFELIDLGLLSDGRPAYYLFATK